MIGVIHFVEHQCIVVTPAVRMEAVALVDAVLDVPDLLAVHRRLLRLI